MSCVFLLRRGCYNWCALRLAKKNRHDVAEVKILGDIFGDDRLIGFEEIEIVAAHSGGDLKADVEKLAETGIVSR
jgi:hypothetical protein